MENEIETLQRLIDEAKARKAEADRYKRIILALVLANGKGFKLPFETLTREQADSLDSLVKTHQIILSRRSICVAPKPVAGESEEQYLATLNFIFEEGGK